MATSCTYYETPPELNCYAVSKQWCDSAGQLQTGGYCKECGQYDSSCGGPCNPPSVACTNAKCINGTCDLAASAWCNNGYWEKNTASANKYCNICGLKDSLCAAFVGGACEAGACDIVKNKTCVSQVIGVPQWTTEAFSSRCGGRTSEWPPPAGGCIVGVCDTKANKFCRTDKTWASSYSYEEMCAGVDFDFGTQICISGSCDYNNKKWCNASKVWTTHLYCDTHACGTSDQTCPPCNPSSLWQEINCIDGLDNDLDCSYDCYDSDCTGKTGCLGAQCTGSQTEPCPLTQGVCAGKTKTCVNGVWSACSYGTDYQPTETKCDGKDNDCDGSVDEMADCCDPADGCTIISPSMQQCNILKKCCGTDRKWHYTQDDNPSPEVCDTVDNNCDGVIDEGCGCSVGATQECGVAVGICVKGIQTCESQAGIVAWGACLPKTPTDTITPQNENTTFTCVDMQDNDCDGLADSQDPNCANLSIDPCYNTIMDAGELGIDCGGSCSTPCPTCNDTTQNQGELGVDCGGPCSPCPECKTNAECSSDEECKSGKCEKKLNQTNVQQPVTEKDTDKDGVSDEQELEAGTDPDSPDTDKDGATDKDDDMPLCPNEVCNTAYGEDEETCPDDCTVGFSLPSWWIYAAIPIAAIVILVAAYFLVGKKKKPAEEVKQQYSQQTPLWFQQPFQKKPGM